MIKGGDSLERAGKIFTIAFDKTGTLTIGKPKVSGALCFNDQAKVMREKIRILWNGINFKSRLKVVLYWAGIAESAS